MPQVKKTFIINVCPKAYVASCTPAEIKELQKLLKPHTNPSRNKLKRMNTKY